MLIKINLSEKKFQIKAFFIGLLTAVILFTALTSQAQINASEQSADYDSLMKAFRQTQSGEGQLANSFGPQLPMRLLEASDFGANNLFGASAAISGNMAIIGAPNADIGSNANQGAAYVFVRSGANWIQQAKLTARDGEAGDSFGNSVAISGSTVIIGAVSDDAGTVVNKGSAYIFTRSFIDNTWGAGTKISASDGATGDYFGISVGISGSTVIIGSYGTQNNRGSAYIYVQPPLSSAWNFQAKLAVFDAAPDDYFGNSVAIAGNTAIVGIPLDDVGTSSTHGSAAVFVRSGTNWTQQARLFANDGAAGDTFGRSVAISSETVIIGASRDDIGTNADQGSAYIFVRSGTNWTQQAKFFEANGDALDEFGGSVSILGDNALIGASLSDSESNNDDGAAFFFTRSGTSWRMRNELTFYCGQNCFLGSSTALGVGFALAGMPFLDYGAENAGGVTVFSFHTPFDFDADQKTDIAVYRPGPGEWWINRSSSNTTFAAQFGSSTDKMVPGDYTNDGRADIAIWRPSTGEWFILRSENSTYYSFPFGTNGDIPAPADYDLDGETNAAVFRPSSGTWFINDLSGSTVIFQFGINGDVPVPADYDGDGRDDAAIYRPSNGQWWIRRSASGVIAFTFGNSADKPVQGDYTGDGKADVAIWRPSTGEWFILRSEDFSYYSFPFGTTGDAPAPGDYDGDGKYDATIFRPSSATWFIQQSAAGVNIQQFGLTGDIPVPAAFVPGIFWRD